MKRNINNFLNSGVLDFLKDFMESFGIHADENRITHKRIAIPDPDGNAKKSPLRDIAGVRGNLKKRRMPKSFASFSWKSKETAWNN